MDYEFLRRFLKDHKISREQFAKTVGVSVYTVNNWFNRKPKRFPSDLAFKIASVYQIPWYQLMGYEEVDEGLYARLPTVDEVNDNEDVDIPVRDSEGKYLYTASTTSGKLPSQNEAAIMIPFRDLNDVGQKKAIDAVETLAKVPEYQKKRLKRR